MHVRKDTRVALSAVVVATLATSFGCSGGPVTPEPVPQRSRAPAYPFAAVRPSAPDDVQTSALIAYYRAWKNAFVRQDCGPGTFQIYSPDAGHPFVAEAQGYGLVITASMSRYDRQARTVFDGLLAYVLAHPSTINGDLTAAEQGEWPATSGSDSPTCSPAGIICCSSPGWCCWPGDRGGRGARATGLHGDPRRAGWRGRRAR